MLRRGGAKKKNTNRDLYREMAVMCCGVLLCAAAFVLTIAARIKITALSDETTGLNKQIQELQIQERSARAAYERSRAIENLAEAAGAYGMVAPGTVEYVVVEGPVDDCTVLFPAYQTILDEEKTIWEYFG